MRFPFSDSWLHQLFLGPPLSFLNNDKNIHFQVTNKFLNLNHRTMKSYGQRVDIFYLFLTHALIRSMLFLNVKRKSLTSTHSIWFKSFLSKSCFVDSLPHLFSSIPTTLPGALSPRDPILAHVACHQFPPQ